MFCTKCGLEIDEKYGVCSRCGAILVSAKEQPKPTPNKVASQPVKPAVNPVQDMQEALKAEKAALKAEREALQAEKAALQAQKFGFAGQNRGEFSNQPSYFTGTMIALLGITLLTSLLSTITFGFAYPAMYCFKKRWIYANTIIGGHRLRFTGSGGQLFGRYILWVLLTAVTFGVYSLCLPIHFQRWETKHIEIGEKVER